MLLDHTLHSNIKVKTTFIKTVIGDVECYWQCGDDTVHYKFDKTVNFCGFRCATMSPITVFINIVFYFYESKMQSFLVIYGKNARLQL